MKKFILIENQVTKLTPFKHFHDLINLQVNKDNVGGIGFDDIHSFDQRLSLFQHNEFKAPFYLELDGIKCWIKSWQGDRTKVPFEEVIAKLHEKDTNRSWVACCWPNANKDNRIDQIQYVYRKKSDMKLYDMFSDQLIANGESIISNTLFLIHAEWPGAPLYHVMLNDNLVFSGIQSVNNENFYVDTVSYHDGIFSEYVFKPRASKCFIQDGVIVSPGKKFRINFFGRSCLYLNNSKFPFDTLKLKISSNLKHTKIDTGIFEFDLEEKQTGYLYARVVADYGADVDTSTQMRQAYTVHRSDK